MMPSPSDTKAGIMPTSDVKVLSLDRARDLAEAKAALLDFARALARQHALRDHHLGFQNRMVNHEKL